MTDLALEQRALDRLAELGLSYEQIRRPLLRADAEANLTTDLEPPTAEGITRYNKINRFLREELVPAGWKYDNSQNYCRTIHPSGSFAIVASSGDDGTGVLVLGQGPSTKYPKGETTVRAIAGNSHPMLDFGDGFELEVPLPTPTSIWYLLYRVTSEQIFAELSLPSEIVNGRITHWSARIILDPIARAVGDSAADEPRDNGDEEYAVEVEMR